MLNDYCTYSNPMRTVYLCVLNYKIHPSFVLVCLNQSWIYYGNQGWKWAQNNYSLVTMASLFLQNWLCKSVQLDFMTKVTMKYNVLQAICVGTDPVWLSIRSKGLSCTGIIRRVIAQRRSRPYLWVIIGPWRKKTDSRKGLRKLCWGFLGLREIVNYVTFFSKSSWSFLKGQKYSRSKIINFERVQNLTQILSAGNI